MQKKQNRNRLKSGKAQSKNTLKTPSVETPLSNTEKKYKNSLLDTSSKKEGMNTPEDTKNWQKQFEALNKKYQFLMAEYANYKKNNMKYVENLKKYEGQQLIKKLINEVIDDFDRAMEQAVRAQNIDELKKGISMIYERFMSILKSIGVKKISSKGQPFDPSVHCAIDSTPSKEVPPNHIVYIIKEAYFFQDKLIRPAEVIVSRTPDVETSEIKNSEQ